MRVPSGRVLQERGAERSDTEENSAEWRGHTVCRTRGSAARTVDVRLCGRRGCVVRHRNRGIVQFCRWLDYARAALDAAQRLGMAMAAGKRTETFVAEIFAGGLAFFWNAAAGQVKENLGAAAGLKVTADEGI